MWRFGIAAFLLLVLFVLVADMLFGGGGSARGLRSYLPSYWYAALTNGPNADDHTRSRSPGVGGGQSADGWIAQIRASLSGDLSNPQGKSSARKSDDAPPSSSNMLTALPRASDVPFDEPWPAYTRFEGATTVPVPTARPVEAPLSRDSAKGEQQEAHDASGTARINQEGQPSFLNKVTTRQIAELQSRLAALGYDPGPADGRVGRRTEAAVRTFERDARMPVSGRIDDRLLAILAQETSSRAQLRQRELQAIAPAPLPKTEQSEERDIFGSLLGGFQRLLGRDFDSVRRPDELAAYCRANASNWIYDFGREAFVYCGNVIAGQLSVQAAGPSPEGASAQ
jgi:Putative peptidoglycan binding domain